MTKSDDDNANERIACGVLYIAKLFKKVVFGITTSFSKQHRR